MGAEHPPGGNRHAEIELDNPLAEKSLQENFYPTLEESIGREEAQVRKERKAQTGSTRGEADKRLKSKFFLPLRKQGIFLPEISSYEGCGDTFHRFVKIGSRRCSQKLNVTNRRFILFGRKQRENEGDGTVFWSIK